ncbi:MAG: hypothetical protein SCALA702_05840 [Melioribacteraceae bacterium]|nr:MAG: hypothetical protein SCALA702_05840 [Melioribacteraceae bacterium]
MKTGIYFFEMYSETIALRQLTHGFNRGWKNKENSTLTVSTVSKRKTVETVPEELAALDQPTTEVAG